MSQQNLRAFQSGFIEVSTSAETGSSFRAITARLLEAQRNLNAALYYIEKARSTKFGSEEEVKHYIKDLAANIARQMAKAISNTVLAASRVGVNVSCDMQVKRCHSGTQGLVDWWHPNLWQPTEANPHEFWTAYNRREDRYFGGEKPHKYPTAGEASAAAHALDVQSGSTTGEWQVKKFPNWD